MKTTVIKKWTEYDIKITHNKKSVLVSLYYNHVNKTFNLCEEYESGLSFDDSNLDELTIKIKALQEAKRIVKIIES